MKQQEQNHIRYMKQTKKVIEMKLETLAYDNIKKVLPQGAEKTVVYASISDTCYEIFFYSFFPKKGYKQCYELAEENNLDAALLDITFERIAEVIKNDKQYKSGKINLFTFIIDDDGIRMDTEYLDKNTRIYFIKKEWKEKYLQ